MSIFYSAYHRDLQSQHETQDLADRLEAMIVSQKVDAHHQAFIESRDFFFLTTIDQRGYPTCSHKGGQPGLITVVNPSELAFPSYDGNGMYLSMGNINGNEKIGMLMMDFQIPHRLRIHGNARIEENDSLLKKYPGAELMVRVDIQEIFINCPRYIHRMEPKEPSKYAPSDLGKAPAPQWKRIDALQDVLPPKDQGIADELGGQISLDAYGELVMKGQA